MSFYVFLLKRFSLLFGGEDARAQSSNEIFSKYAPIIYAMFIRIGDLNRYIAETQKKRLLHSSLDRLDFLKNFDTRYEKVSILSYNAAIVLDNLNGQGHNQLSLALGGGRDIMSTFSHVRGIKNRDCFLHLFSLDNIIRALYHQIKR